MNGISPQLQNQITQFQQVQQQLQAVSSQKIQMDAQKRELTRTREELEKATGAVYKTAGSLLIKVEDVDALKADLDESIEMMDVRIASMERQETSLKEKYTVLQQTISVAMGNAPASEDEERIHLRNRLPFFYTIYNYGHYPCMTDALVLNDVRKSYGNREAVHGISLTVQEGEIFGLIGHNGAGKTTTLRMISTLLRITSGTIEVYGHDVSKEPEKVRELISYLPEDAGAYKDLTGRKYLQFIANFFTGGDDNEAMVQRGIEIADLGDRIDSKVDTYSKGMMRRLLIARAIMTAPKLAIMDEVTSGLDVINAYEIREIIRKIAASGVTVVMSSHNMFEVEMLCDRVGLIDHGNLVLLGRPDDLKREHNAGSLEEVFVKVIKAAEEASE